jgi:nickel/cobalt transporter (NicO) family protein
MRGRLAPRRAACLAGVVAALVVLPAAAAHAHPLGNFTVNQYSGVRVEPSRVDVDYVVDMAEIPTFQARQVIDGDGDGVVSPAEAGRWRLATCARLAVGLRLTLDGRPLALAVTGGRLSFPPGAGGLPTLRLECPLAAATGGGSHALGYRDANYADRIGWREITAVADGTTLTASDAPAGSVSQRLTRYPQDLLRSPLDRRVARLRFRPGGARLAGAGPAEAAGRAAVPLGVDRATRAFTDLVARQRLGLAFGLAAVGLALLLGAVHALAPGHGKTVMAAYLLGQRGSLRQALLVGLTVTATHTAGVLALGVALSTSSVLAPERLYPWLGLASGLLLASIGVSLLRRALRRHHPPHRHPHEHPHPHGHEPVAAPAGGQGPGVGSDGGGDLAAGPGLTWRSLVPMGFAGGLVPSPSALVVLLGALALGRAWFGVLLVTAYGIGMAATLTGAGLLLVRARSAVDRWSARGRGERLAGLGRLLPIGTATVIVLVGVFLTARGALAV